MNLQLGMVMDPIESIKSYKDSSFAMMLAAQKKGWRIHYMQPRDLYLDNSRVYARRQIIKVHDDKHLNSHTNMCSSSPLIALTHAAD